MNTGHDDGHGTKNSIGFIAVGLAVLSFSISASLIKWADSIGSVIAFWRMIGAVIGWWIVLAVLRLRTGRPWPSAATWKVVLLPALFFGLNISIFFTAITRTSIAHAEFISTLTPLVLLPAGVVFFGERPDWKPLRYGLISVGGLILVLAFGPAGGAATLAGDLLMLVVIATWTCYLVTSKRARAQGIDTLDFMACTMPLGLITAGPVAASIAGDDLFSLTARGWFVVGVLAILTGMVAHGCIIFAQRHLPVANIGIVQTTQPALSVMWGFVILGESVRFPQIVGMALALLGIALFTWSTQRATPAAPVVAITDLRGDPERSPK